ncbi:gamma-type small acid-soluble spore protein [Lysinibacillus pakistanensis]|uniref:gamma-type small acid-soluble spore protein n=1 Tax=Lysinibacillus pakistanensis TaxID=759811 RepID=UPI003D27CBF2
MSKNRNKNRTADQIRQKIQQAEANKIQASGRYLMNSTNNVEFGTETDANQVRQQIQNAETEYLQGASGPKANYGFGNNLN